MIVKSGDIMENNLILEIDNVGPISLANIEIGKINIVGGKNSTGKSTSSKLLYCFLKANSSNTEDGTFENFYNSVRNVDRYLFSTSPYFNKDDFQNLSEHFFILKNACVNYQDKEEIIKYFDEFSKVLYESLEKNDDDIMKRDHRFKTFMRLFNDMENFVSKNLKHPEKIYILNLQQYIDSEFNIREESDFGGIAQLYLSDKSFEQKINFEEYLFDHLNSFPIEEIYYLDSFSLFDDDTQGLLNSEHVQSLTKSLYEPYKIKPGMDDYLDEIIKQLELEINKIINGKITAIRRKENIFTSNEDVSSPMKNTASGIKQIGIVQRLLNNHKLTPGSFLIIDEPEVNLHPEWQVKFAEILVLLVSELDISVYINTHSPMFIESLALFSEFYDLLDDTNLYLTEKDDDYLLSDIEKYTFKKINPKNMGAIYENLSRPYDDLDKLKSDILNKKIING